jgi:uncharacterized membrane protein
MSRQESKYLSITRRLDRTIRHERLRSILVVAGVALVSVGILMVMLPFGQPIANPVAILNVDPHAGIGLAQALASGTARRFGLVLALAGVAMFVILGLVGTDRPRGDGGDTSGQSPNTSLERTRER